MPIVSAIIQSRETSKRFPGKCHAMLHGSTLLESVVNRVKLSNKVDRVVVASPSIPFCNVSCSVFVWDGDENDLVGRYLWVAKKLKSDYVVRITADCPLIRPLDIDRCVDLMLLNKCDMVTNGYRNGFEVEVLSTDVLVRINNDVKSSYEREHVTLNIRNNPWNYFIMSYPANDVPDGDWSIDTPEDLARIENATDDKCNIVT